MVNHNQNLFLMVSYCSCLFGEFAKVFDKYVYANIDKTLGEPDSMFGRLLEGVGALVAMIGIGQIIAGYLYPNTGSELTNAVEKFEEV